MIVNERKIRKVMPMFPAKQNQYLNNYSMAMKLRKTFFLQFTPFFFLRRLIEMHKNKVLELLRKRNKNITN